MEEEKLKIVWNRPHMIICSADDFFETTYKFDKESGYKFDGSKLGEAHAQCLRRTIGGMIDQVPIIAVDNTNTTVLEMAPYYACAQAYGYEVELVTFRINPGDAYMRGTHNVPLGTIVAQNKRIKGIEIPPHWKITRNPRWEISAEYR